MKLEQSFEVQAPVERVWSTLLDVERVAPCLPGAAVSARNDDGSFDGTFTIKIGPTTASYAGKLKLERVDEAARTATIQADGTDRRGQGGARATIVSTVAPTDSGATRVEVVTDYQITGRLARFGRGGMIEDISEKLLQEFARRLQATLAGDGGESAGVATAEQPAGPGASAEVAPEWAGDGGPGAAGDGGPGAAGEPAQVEPLRANSLVASVLWDRARHNPVGPGAILVGLLLALVLIRRRR